MKKHVLILHEFALKPKEKGSSLLFCCKCRMQLNDESHSFVQRSVVMKHSFGNSEVSICPEIIMNPSVGTSVHSGLTILPYLGTKEWLPT